MPLTAKDMGPIFSNLQQFDFDKSNGDFPISACEFRRKACLSYKTINYIVMFRPSKSSDPDSNALNTNFICHLVVTYDKTESVKNWMMFVVNVSRSSSPIK